MKRILTQTNSVVLQEISNGEITLQLGYALGGITYKIENNNVKFYLKDDYFYKNCIFSADLPLNIDGTEYDADHIAEAMGDMFPTSGGSGGSDVTSVNGKTGAVTLTAADVDAYTKAEVDGIVDDLGIDVEGLEQDIDTLEANVYTKSEVDAALNDKQDKLTAGQNIIIDANNVISATGGGGMEQIQSDWNQSDSTKVDFIKNKPTIPDVSNYYTKSEVDSELALKQDASTAFSGDYNDLTNKPTIPDVSNYYTKSEVDSALNTKEDISDAFSGDYNDLTNKPVIPDVSNYYTKSEVDTELSTKQDASTAFSGDYDDLTNKPDLSVYALKFTDVDDIQLVNALPANPDSRTLYLIPVQ